MNFVRSSLIFIFFSVFASFCFSARAAGSFTVESGGSIVLDNGSIYADGDVVLNGGQVRVIGGTITLKGSWRNGGSFTCGTGSVVMRGTAAASILGDNTFYNLSLVPLDGSRTISLEAAKTQTVGGSLSLSNTEGKVLYLRSTSSGTRAKFKLSRSLSGAAYINVRDNIVLSPYTISCLASCVNSGNNSGWIFYKPPDKTPPSISGLTPSPDSEGVGLAPLIGASLYDASSGINTASLRVILDGGDISGAVSLSETGFSYRASSLSQGAHTVSVTVSDKAGNSKNVSWSFSVYDGSNVGASGALLESSSSAATVSLDIPAGALNGETAIAIIPVAPGPLQPSAPADTEVVAAVKCLPHGISFEQPVVLTYVFRRAQVPGTVIELGLYDADTGLMSATGATYTIGPDGCTASFSVAHFSTYAALAPMAATSAPIGGGVKIPLPDMFTGAFSHSVPVAVVPGRAGMQPNLNLTYRSSNPNSWLGVGFNLNPGYITRSTRLGPPVYSDTEDTFYFINDAGTTELVHLVDNLYQAKIESGFTKFYKEEDDSWRVVSKDGSLIYLGQSAESKETAPGGTYSWYVTRAQDTNGNYIDYSYIKDSGKCYLSRIDYTASTVGLAPSNSVEFFLEDRTDVPSSFMSGGKIMTARRLKEIQVKQNDALVWRYVLNYIYSADTGRSLLQSVEQYASDGTALPPQVFSYQSN